MPESAFRQALDRINENGRFLPKSNLVSLSERLPPNDSHFASRRGQSKHLFNCVKIKFWSQISCSVSDAPQRIGGCSWPIVVVDFVSHPVHLRCLGNSARQHGLSIETPPDPLRHQFASAPNGFRAGVRGRHPHLGMDRIHHSLRGGGSHGETPALAQSLNHFRLQNQRAEIASNG